MTATVTTPPGAARPHVARRRRERLPRVAAAHHSAANSSVRRYFLRFRSSRASASATGKTPCTVLSRVRTFTVALDISASPTTACARGMEAQRSARHRSWSIFGRHAAQRGPAQRTEQRPARTKDKVVLSQLRVADLFVERVAAVVHVDVKLLRDTLCLDLARSRGSSAVSHAVGTGVRTHLAGACCSREAARATTYLLCVRGIRRRNRDDADLARRQPQRPDPSAVRSCRAIGRRGECEREGARGGGAMTRRPRRAARAASCG